jgi:hypothetical protein
LSLLVLLTSELSSSMMVLVGTADGDCGCDFSGVLLKRLPMVDYSLTNENFK